MKKKIVSLVLVFAMALALGIGGTVAWLTAKTTSVVNTFTVGDINIKLDETDADNDNDPLANSYKMVPGSTIAKDPKVTVLANSEDCWLFVKVEKANNFDTYMTYIMAEGWIQLTDANDEAVDGVFYRKVSAATTDTEIPVLKDNTVTVNDTVTKAMVNALGTYNDDGTYTYDSTKLPKLTFTAYAIQQANIGTVGAEDAANAAAAWAELNAQ